MRIKLEADFLERFPEASIHALVYDGVDRVTGRLAEQWRAQAQAQMLAMNIAPDRLVEREEIKEWRVAYSQFGLKPSKYRSSIEQLWRRAIQGNLVRTPVELVNVYCYVSVLSGSAMGGYDLDRVCGDLHVRLAEQGETFTGIGEQQAVNVSAGVVVYADDAGVLCYGWNHRDGARTALQPETCRAIFFADSALASSKSRAARAILQLRAALDQAGARFVVSEVLTAENREVDIFLQ